MSIPKVNYGTVCSANVEYLIEKNLLICAFDSSLNIYNIQQNPQLLFSFSECDSNISNFSVFNRDGFQEIVVVYISGIIIHYNININFQKFKQQRIKADLTNCLFFQDFLIIRQNQKYLKYNLTTQKIINEFQNPEIVTQNLKKDSYLLISFDGKFLIDIINKTIYIYNLIGLNLMRRLKHHQSITSASLNNDTLALGDIQGKIYYIYEIFNLQNQDMLENQNIQHSKQLHWHSKPVSSLHFTEDNNFLISGGEEGVLVLWHSQGNKHDFIPRLGSKIVKIKTIENYIISIFQNNNIKILNLDTYTQKFCLQGISEIQQNLEIQQNEDFSNLTQVYKGQIFQYNPFNQFCSHSQYIYSQNQILQDNTEIYCFKNYDEEFLVGMKSSVSDFFRIIRKNQENLNFYNTKVDGILVHKKRVITFGKKIIIWNPENWTQVWDEKINGFLQGVSTVNQLIFADQQFIEYVIQQFQDSDNQIWGRKAQIPKKSDIKWIKMQVLEENLLFAHDHGFGILNLYNFEVFFYQEANHVKDIQVHQKFFYVLIQSNEHISSCVKMKFENNNCFLVTIQNIKKQLEQLKFLAQDNKQSIQIRKFLLGFSLQSAFIELDSYKYQTNNQNKPDLQKETKVQQEKINKYVQENETLIQNQDPFEVEFDKIRIPFSVKKFQPQTVFDENSHLIPNLDLLYKQYISSYSMEFKVNNIKQNYSYRQSFLTNYDEDQKNPSQQNQIEKPQQKIISQRKTLKYEEIQKKIQSLYN